jgi:hypothetical protein
MYHEQQAQTNQAQYQPGTVTEAHGHRGTGGKGAEQKCHAQQHVGVFQHLVGAKYRLQARYISGA